MINRNVQEQLTSGAGIVKGTPRSLASWYRRTTSQIPNPKKIVKGQTMLNPSSSYSWSSYRYSELIESASPSRNELIVADENGGDDPVQSSNCKPGRDSASCPVTYRVVQPVCESRRQLFETYCILEGTTCIGREMQQAVFTMHGNP